MGNRPEEIIIILIKIYQEIGGGKRPFERD